MVRNMNVLSAVAMFAGLSFTFAGATQTKYFSVISVIQNHFAETTVESEILNDKNATAQVKFHIMLPKEAYISSFVMTIDGKTYDAVIEEKQKAKEKFIEARRRGHTAGLVETRAKADKILATDVNVGANTAVTFKIVYQQILRSLGGRFTNKIILFGDSLSEHLTVDVYICEAKSITDVDVPPILLNGGGGTVDSGSIVSKNGNTAHVSFAGNNDILNAVVARGGGSFSVEYVLEKDYNSADVVVDNGYFIFFGPDVPIQPKRIIFCLDDSGSMVGAKSRQVKEAMTNILDNLMTKDRVGIIKFSSSTRSWRTALQDATPENTRNAKLFVRGPDESGSTAIWQAMLKAIIMMRAEHESSHQIKPEDNLIILLSDGQGDIGSSMLLNNVEKLNKKSFTIHTISFGNGADDQMLQTMARSNHGRWKKILSDLDAALQIENYVNELRRGTASALAEFVNYPEVVEETFSVMNTNEMMTVGRFREEISLYSNGPHDIVLNTSLGTAFAHTGSITTGFYLNQPNGICEGIDGKHVQTFTKKAFAMTKIEQLLNRRDLEEDPKEKVLLQQKAINMSIEYHLVTSVTSLLVIKPEDDRNIEESLQSVNSQKSIPATTTSQPITLPSPAIAALKYHQRKASSSPRWSLHSDPHFIARLSDDVTVCFDWVGRNNEVVNLLHDYNNSIVINGLISGAEGDKENNILTSQLFVTKLVFLLTEDDIRIEIDCDGFSISNIDLNEEGAYQLNTSFQDTDRRSYIFGAVKIHLTDIGQHHIIVNVRIRKSLFVVEIQFKNTRPRSRNHLDLIVPEYTSQKIGGIFGHLQMTESTTRGRARLVKEEKRNKMFLLYNDDKVQVRRSSMKVPYLQESIPCWKVKSHLHHLFGSKLGSFKLRSLRDIPDAT